MVQFCCVRDALLTRRKESETLHEQGCDEGRGRSRVEESEAHHVGSGTCAAWAAETRSGRVEPGVEHFGVDGGGGFPEGGRGTLGGYCAYRRGDGLAGHVRSNTSMRLGVIWPIRFLPIHVPRVRYRLTGQEAPLETYTRWQRLAARTHAGRFSRRPEGAEMSGL